MDSGKRRIRMAESTRKKIGWKKELEDVLHYGVVFALVRQSTR